MYYVIIPRNNKKTICADVTELCVIIQYWTWFCGRGRSGWAR